MQTCHQPYSLGCAFRRNSGGFRRKWDKDTGRNGMQTEQALECAITILDIPVHYGWYLSTRFLHVEKARTYSK